MSDRLDEIRSRLEAADWSPDERGFPPFQIWTDGKITVYRSGCSDLLSHAPSDIKWLAVGYALAVDTIWAGYEAVEGKRMPASERKLMLDGWGVSEEDIEWAKSVANE